jgi:hypothetical protein
MRLLLIPVLLALPLAAQAKKQKPLTPAQMKAEIKKLTKERDELQSRIAAAEGLRSDLSSAQKARDLAKEETKRVQEELDGLRASLKENQAGFEPLLKELKTTKASLAECQGLNEKLKLELEVLQPKTEGPQEGTLVPLGDGITPARPINLNRITPRLEGWGHPKGVVVVNVLVDHKGEVVATRLLQGLPGEGEKVTAANDACVEAAKKLVFDPARTKEGVKVRVWQGVGFWLE